MSDDPAVGNLKSSTISVLLVEDDDVNALLLQRMLSLWRFGAFNIRRAENLSAALLEAVQGGIDIVLLDLGLPDSLGFDTFVRMHEAEASLPIIVLTGMDDEVLAIKTVQHGAQDYIVKGEFDGASLARAILYAIERARVRQALADEHDLLRSVIDNIPDQIYLKDENSRFIAVNTATVRFFGASSPEKLIGKCDFDFFPRELAAQFMAEEQALMHRNQSCINREAAITDSDGNSRWVLTTKVPLRGHNGNITGLLGINHDITTRKKTEEAICSLNAELEHRVAERTTELHKAVARLEGHDRARAEFVSSVSHELKTPLASMKFAIANLLEGVVGPMSDPATEYLRMLDTDCQRMINTVDDILDFSRLESKTMKLHLSKHPLDRLIRRGAAVLKAQAQTRNIETVFSFDRGLGFVECDALKMVRVIINIIGNAIKFTPYGGKVEIGLNRESAALVIEITDNGIGIAPQHLARVTEKYFRTGEHISGVGLGLSIAKEIIELHGGRLAIQSPPPGRDRGTRVSVSLPVTAPPAILIANNDEPVRALLEQQLRAYGYQVIPCADRDDVVIDLARQVKPDVVILDVSTSGICEANLLFRMKADLNLQGIPIIGVVDGIIDATAQVILNGLRVLILPKPWHEEKLLDRIEGAIRGVSLFNVTNT